MVVRKSESLADVDRAALERRSFLTRGGVYAVTGYVMYANKRHGRQCARRCEVVGWREDAQS